MARRPGRPPGDSTRAVHGGERDRRLSAAVTTPIYQTSTFWFRDSAELREYQEGRLQREEYGRYGNPTWKAVEGKLCQLEGAEEGSQIDFIYEPSKTELLETIMPMYVHVETYRATLESTASEFGARMTAMENATNNARDMISSLTLEFNKARQASITKELLDIVGGANAVE